VVASVAEFTLVAVHTQPKAAVAEIDHLVDVHQFVSLLGYFRSYRYQFLAFSFFGRRGGRYVEQERKK
jgi:hypothetical protein